MNNKLLFSQFVIILCLTSVVHASQLEFSRHTTAKSVVFNYAWRDHYQAIQRLTFSLPKKDVFNRFRNLKVFKPKFAEQYVEQQLRQNITNHPVPNVTVALNSNPDDTHISVSGSDQQQIAQVRAKLNALQQKFYTEYLAANDYQLLSMPDNTSGVIPNHSAIAHASVDDLKDIKSIILAKVSIRNIRKVTNYVLGFVQNIPYATLTSRISASGSGFNPPLKLLYENQGDCDSKMTLTIAILRSLMPRIKLAFVYINHHALIGINIEPKADEITITQNNIVFVLAEPTGPAMYPLGKVAPMSKQAILHHLYVAKIFN